MKLYVFIVACALALTGCHNHDAHGDHDEHDGHNHENEAAAGHSSDEIVLTPEKAAAAGVTSDTVRMTEFSAVIPVSGRIMPASGDRATVASTVSGIVSLRPSLTEGSQVSKGAQLATVATASIAEGDVARRAGVAFRAAEAEYERVKALYADRLVPEKMLTEAKAEYDRALIAYDAVGKSTGGGITLTAPIGGYVTDVLVTDGDYVETGQPLMMLVQNRRLYLRAEVSGRDYPVMGSVVSAYFRVAGDERLYDLAELDGRIVSIGRSTDSESPFVPVTFEFDNTGALLPGSYAEIFLITTARHNAIALPESALTEEQGVYYVYLREDEECYRKQPVTIGASDGRLTEITSGLKEGDVVVTRGAIHVKLASAGKAIPGHTHNH